MDTLNPEKCWQMVLDRDSHADGCFVYGVRSTRIYCRPSCVAKRPRRDQIVFFGVPEAAEAAGYRPCMRCLPRESAMPEPQGRWVRQLCRFVEQYDWVDGPPTLAAMAHHVQLSPHHMQRTFKRIMGITPRQYAEACRVRRLKGLLKDGREVTGALYEAGYGSSSRLYESASARLGMTPATYRRGGKGMRIGYTVADCDLGRLLVAGTERGICAVELGELDDHLIAALSRQYPYAQINADQEGLGEYVRAILDHLRGERIRLDLPLDIRITGFQWQVYDALRDIPYGVTRSYGEVADSIGRPKAARAVARACATNPVALIVPCHRVLRGGGEPGGYRWGRKIKEALLRKEQRAR